MPSLSCSISIFLTHGGSPYDERVLMCMTIACTRGRRLPATPSWSSLWQEGWVHEAMGRAAI